LFIKDFKSAYVISGENFNYANNKDGVIREGCSPFLISHRMAFFIAKKTLIKEISKYD